jgi:hypothetical protein
MRGNPYILLPRLYFVQGSTQPRGLQIQGSVEAVRSPKMKKTNAPPLAGVFPHGRTASLRSYSNYRAETELRARFFGVHGLVTWMTSVQEIAPTRTVWRFHVPRIWIRSINPRANPVKRKSQNVDNFFFGRLYLVVLLHAHSPSLSPFSSRFFLLNSFLPILYAISIFPLRVLLSFPYLLCSVLAESRAGHDFFSYHRHKNLYPWHF